MLSFDQDDLLIGNFIADHIRLRQADHLPESIKRGIRLHRKIDQFTDYHPLFIKSKRYFYEGFERYSGVLMDIYFDHVLARNFERYSEMELDDYSKKVYGILDNNETHLPESAKRFLAYAKKNNTFYEYSKISGITLVLQHLSYRINHGIDLSLSVPMFEKNYDEIEKDFFIFMEDMHAYLRQESF
jgi:acyl carrier protein phosphodiesterase